MNDIPGDRMRAARAELVVNAKTGETPKNRYAVEVEVDEDYVFIFPQTVVIAPTPEMQAMRAEFDEGKTMVLARKMPSTIRVWSDVENARTSLMGVFEEVREIMRTSYQNEPTEEQAQKLVGMVGIVIERLANIQGDLTMGVKK